MGLYEVFQINSGLTELLADAVELIPILVYICRTVPKVLSNDLTCYFIKQFLSIGVR